MKQVTASLILIAMVAAAQPALAAGKAQAGLVARDGAPVYSKKAGGTTRATLPRGTSVVGVTMGLGAADGGAISAYEFDEVGGRIHVAYFPPGKNDQGLYHTGWMEASDVSQFSYECGCGQTTVYGDNSCSPFSVKGLVNYRFNSCYKEARDKKLADFGVDEDQAEVKTAKKEKSSAAGAAFCPHCGGRIAKGAKFCGGCGKPAK